MIIDINDLTHRIIGCAMKVHGTLGGGFQERIYQRALALELRQAGLSFAQEKNMDIWGNGRGESLGTKLNFRPVSGSGFRARRASV